MSNKYRSQKSKYDLRDRTAKFGASVTRFVKTLPDSTINRPLISQLVRSSTSIGANYMEADGAESKKDFIHKIALCKKEAKESTHWLHMIAIANVSYSNELRQLWKEARELTLIFSAILIKKKAVPTV